MSREELFGYSAESTDTMTTKEYATSKSAGDGAVAACFMIPLMLLSAVSMVMGWLVARWGFRYSIVRLVLFPAVFTVANVLFFLCMIPVFFLLAANGMDLAVVGDLTLWEPIFRPMLFGFWGLVFPISNPPVEMSGTEPLWICLYQIGVWYLFGKWMLRNLTLAFFDAATVKIALKTGVDTNELRITRAKKDKAFRKAALFYDTRNVMPPWSIASVAFAGADVDHYFGA